MFEKPFAKLTPMLFTVCQFGERVCCRVRYTKEEHFGHSIGPSDICQTDFVQLCATGKRSEGYKDSGMKRFGISLMETRIKHMKSTCDTILWHYMHWCHSGVYSACSLLKINTG